MDFAMPETDSEVISRPKHQDAEDVRYHQPKWGTALRVEDSTIGGPCGASLTKPRERGTPDAAGSRNVGVRYCQTSRRIEASWLGESTNLTCSSLVWGRRCCLQQPMIARQLATESGPDAWKACRIIPLQLLIPLHPVCVRQRDKFRGFVCPLHLETGCAGLT